MIERERATALHAWPHQQSALAEHPSAATRDLSSLVKLDSHSPVAELAGDREGRVRRRRFVRSLGDLHDLQRDPRRLAGRAAQGVQRRAVAGRVDADRRPA
jgi:hypothetical protein